MRQKILYLVTSSGWGGAERYVSVLASALRHAYDVHILTGSSSASEKLFESLPDGIRYGKLPSFRREISPLKDFVAANELRAYVDEHDIDIIHCNSSKAGLIGALAINKCKRKPKLIYTAHGWGFLENRSPLFKALIACSEKYAAKFRDATIVLSEAERRAALEHGLSSEKNLHVIPHGIDEGELTFLGRDEARDRLGKHGLIVGTIANAYPAKALHLLIEAFERCAPSWPEAQLLIIGDGPEMPKLRELAAASPAKDRIILRGHLDGAASHLKAFDLFVLSSTKEGMPWVVLEASLAGCPIIATRVGALPEMITDGQTGILVEAGNADALANAIQSVLEDDLKRQRLKGRAPEIAERYSASRMMQRMRELYALLLRSES